MLKFAKYIEKSGMTLSHMKNMMRAARAAGTPILRNKDQLRAHLNENTLPWLKNVPFVGEKLRSGIVNKLTDAIDGTGPSMTNLPSGFGNVTYVPRNFKEIAGPNYSPRAALLHELGHREHFSEDPLTWGRIIRKPFNTTPRSSAVETNLAETIANNNAILNMRNAGVPEHLIETYKTKTQSPFYNSYAQNLEFALGLRKTPFKPELYRTHAQNKANALKENIGVMSSLAAKGIKRGLNTAGNKIKNIWEGVQNRFNSTPRPLGGVQPPQPSSMPQPRIDPSRFQPPQSQPRIDPSRFQPPQPSSMPQSQPRIDPSRFQPSQPSSMPQPRIDPSKVDFNKMFEEIRNQQIRKSFEPMTEIPNYSHPTLRRYNVPYTVQ
jgi:hypothetical protein